MANRVYNHKGDRMKVATSREGSLEDFRSKFVSEDSPFLGVLLDSDSATKIEVDRDKDREEISYRSQGERLAQWIKSGDEAPVLRIFTPSEDVDMALFNRKIQDFYRAAPEILSYLKDSFDESPEELMEIAEKPDDRDVIAVIFGIYV